MSSFALRLQTDELPEGLRKAIVQHLETKTGRSFGNFIISCKKKDIDELPTDFIGHGYRYCLSEDGRKQLRNLVVSTRKVFDSAKLSQQDIFEAGYIISSRMFLRLQTHLIRQMREFKGHPYLRVAKGEANKLSISFITTNTRRRDFDTVLDGQLDFGFLDTDLIQIYDQALDEASRRNLENSLEILFDDLGGETYAKWDALRQTREGTPFFEPDLGGKD